MVAKAKTSTKKAVASKKPKVVQKSAPKSAPKSHKVDYYPNRVPFLAALAGVSLLMVIALIVTL